MKTTSVFTADPLALGAESKFYFNVVIIYDRRDSAIRAKEIFDRLMARFAGQFHFQCDFWRFDVLDLPEAQQQTSWAGQIADLIIIASETGEVSLNVKRWLEACVPQKAGKPSALVHLFHDLNETDGIEPEVRNFLKPFASGVDFFVHEIHPARSRIYNDERADRGMAVAWAPPSTAWGIND